MDKQYFIELLNKYLRGEATFQEQEFLKGYYNLFQTDPDVIALLNDEAREELENEMRVAIWQKIAAEQGAPSKVVSLKKWLLGTAAAIILIISITAIFYSREEVSKPALSNWSADKPKGNRFFRLPDGSTVIVNAGSRLKYPESFEGSSTREVYLEGEAYFDIKKDPSKPFVVHTEKVTTTVLGTAFIIKAMPEDPTISVTVTRGRVRVGSQDNTNNILTPNQQVIYDRQKRSVVKKEVNADAYLDWKKQDLLFDDVTVAEAASLLEERFKVSITFSDGQIKSNRFTTTFTKVETLEQVLKSICEFNDADYHYQKDQAAVVISKKSRPD